MHAAGRLTTDAGATHHHVIGIRAKLMYNADHEQIRIARELWADAVKAADAAGGDAEVFVTAWLVSGLQLYAKVKGPAAAKALVAMAAAIDETPAGRC
ncbi:MAG: hypothetical protein KDC18_06025 [Alphaproteobacteria bacterium]|nr:hypothetical protein [Alphaproteobacteria bacterium]MCB9931431.1 hypothetical protein [Alphaproteobacteria bacterium]